MTTVELFLAANIVLQIAILSLLVTRIIQSALEDDTERGEDDERED